MSQHPRNAPLLPREEARRIRGIGRARHLIKSGTEGSDCPGMACANGNNQRITSTSGARRKGRRNVRMAWLEQRALLRNGTAENNSRQKARKCNIRKGRKKAPRLPRPLPRPRSGTQSVQRVVNPLCSPGKRAAVAKVYAGAAAMPP